LSVLDLEKRMAFPREHLNFALWYLRAKGLIRHLEDNSDCGITAEGIDFIEKYSSTDELVNRLIQAGTTSRAPFNPDSAASDAHLALAC